MVSILVPTSFDLHNLDPTSHCGQKVRIPQRFFTIIKCVFRITIIPGSGSPCNNQFKRYSNGIILFFCFILFYMLCMQRCEVAPLFISLPICLIKTSKGVRELLERIFLFLRVIM